jgi:NAD(P)-dependent dehydrogenase (short-subunit alcohol dehydrogenase family)
MTPLPGRYQQGSGIDSDREAAVRVLVIGGAGTIGKAVTAALRGRHEVITAGRSSGERRVDMTDAASIRKLFAAIGRIDAVVSCAGDASFKPLAQLRDEDFDLGLGSKLMGQINLVRHGVDSLADGGSFTLTSGILNRYPAPGAAAIAVVNAGIDGFVRAAALELPRGIRINVVSPPWVSETLVAMGRDPSGGLSATVVAEAYVRSVEGTDTGALLEPEGTRALAGAG